MSAPTIGLALDVTVHLLPTDAGGRTQSIVSGYRPLCFIETPNGTERVFGLCWLDLDAPIAPGDSGDGRLSFDIAVSNDVRALLHVGSKFGLAEGAKRVGSAEVRRIDP